VTASAPIGLTAVVTLGVYFPALHRGCGQLIASRLWPADSGALSKTISAGLVSGRFVSCDVKNDHVPSEKPTISHLLRFNLRPSCLAAASSCMKSFIMLAALPPRAMLSKYPRTSSDCRYSNSSLNARQNIAARDGHLVHLQQTAEPCHRIVVRTLDQFSTVRMPTTPENTWRLLPASHKLELLKNGAVVCLCLYGRRTLCLLLIGNVLLLLHI